jgi:hypothetical protein
MLGEMELTSILPSSRVQTRWIDRIAYANDASYFRLVPQAVLQLNSIGEIQYSGGTIGQKACLLKLSAPALFVQLVQWRLLLPT